MPLARPRVAVVAVLASRRAILRWRAYAAREDARAGYFPPLCRAQLLRILALEIGGASSLGLGRSGSLVAIAISAALTRTGEWTRQLLRPSELGCWGAESPIRWALLEHY